ncbi:SUKH-4 family immunity protein [Glycomyces luteolus]|uniref:SUKH-4 family immunity protein n=1 Tax=Glycomyces luteolus TaxID=2670330 RepID=A0A9X3PQ48_9ACTN|nr:SUKH-4 family immunity protein [Glycomyces luteolus]MDA1363110.1 SUKH-4 family immunity protein [Glycomyces luteolus]
MRERQTYVQAWGESNVIRFPRDAWIEQFPAPRETYPDVDVIPIEVSVVFTSLLNGRFDLYSVINLNVGPQSTLQLVVIGAVPADSDNTLFCLDSGTGRVLMLGVSNGTLEPVNATFKQFSEFLYHFAIFVRYDNGKQHRAQRASVLRSQLERIDPSAFADANSWWSVAFTKLESRMS